MRTGREFEDHLTGLPNRRFLDRRLDSLIAEGSGFALLFIDLDRFKAVNDTRGHLCGDQVLEEFASVLSSTVRDSDIVGRWGGDEFVVLAGVERDADAEALASRLASRTESSLGRDWGVTASIGLVFFPGEARTKRELLSMADQAMYTAKNTGRSRWCRAGTPSRHVRWVDDAFVDRSSESARILPLLAGGPPSRLVIVEGESGVGKTAFVEEAVRRAGMAGRRVRLCCRPEFSDIPFAPLIGAVRQASASLGVPGMPAQWARVLGTILPDVFPGQEAVGGSLERVALLEALTALMVRWSPLLVTVEDAHWIDPGTSGFLLYLLHFAPDAGIHVICSFRTDEEPVQAPEPGHPAGSLLSRGDSVVLDLEPLDLRNISELAGACLGGAAVSAELASTIYGISGGNPLFALEFLRALHDSRRLVMRDSMCLAEGGGIGPPPGRVRELISSKLSKLSHQERHVLSAAAAAGEAFDAALLERVVPLPEGDVITALDRAVRMGILAQDASDPLQFAFRNQAYRDETARSSPQDLSIRVNLALASGYWEEGNHRQAALCLQNAGETARAADAWMAAGFDALRKRLVEEAAKCFERAASLLETMPDDPARAGSLLVCREQLHIALLQSGDMERSREACLSAAALAASLGRLPEEAALLSKAGDILRLLGRTGDALETQLALERNAEGETLFRIRLRGLDAASRIGRTDVADRLKKDATSLWKALRVDRRDLDAVYYHKLVLHYICGMDLERAHRAIRRALASPFPEDMGWFLHNDLGEILVLMAKPGRALRAFDSARKAALSLPTLWGLAWSTINLASAMFGRMRFESALALLEEARGTIDRTTDEPSRSCMTLLRGRILLEKGEHGRATELIEESFRRPGFVSGDYFRSLAHSASGRPAEALECAEAAWRLASSPGRRLQLDSGILLTSQDCLVQLHRARLDAGVAGALDDLAALVPGLRYATRTRAVTFLAAGLHAQGRTEEADELLSDASADRSVRQETLALHRLYLTWGMWNPAARAKAARLARLAGT